MGDRKCAYCESPIPAWYHKKRKFCTTDCRLRQTNLNVQNALKASRVQFKPVLKSTEVPLRICVVEGCNEPLGYRYKLFCGKACSLIYREQLKPGKRICKSCGLAKGNRSFLTLKTASTLDSAKVFNPEYEVWGVGAKKLKVCRKCFRDESKQRQYQAV